MTLRDDHTFTSNDVVMISSDDNVDVKDMRGFIKEQLDKSCTSSITRGTSKAPSTVASHLQPGSLCGIKILKRLAH